MRNRRSDASFARRGFRITCLEPGAALAAEARRLLAPFDVEVIASRFEDWEAPQGRFSLVYAATAWHWLVLVSTFATRRRRRCWWPWAPSPSGKRSRSFPMGAIRSSTISSKSTTRSAKDPPVRLGAHLGRRELHRPAEDLLRTHRHGGFWQCGRLYDEIRRRLALRPDGRIRRHWGGVLHIAQRRQD